MLINQYRFHMQVPKTNYHNLNYVNYTQQMKSQQKTGAFVRMLLLQSIPL